MILILASHTTLNFPAKELELVTHCLLERHCKTQLTTACVTLMFQYPLLISDYRYINSNRDCRLQQRSYLA